MSKKEQMLENAKKIRNALQDAYHFSFCDGVFCPDCPLTDGLYCNDLKAVAKSMLDELDRWINENEGKDNEK